MMEFQELSIQTKKASWTKKILAEHKGLGGLASCNRSGQGDYYFSLHSYLSEEELHSSFYDREGKLLHEHHKNTDISFTDFQDRCGGDLTYLLYLSDLDVPKIIGTDPVLLRYYDEKLQIHFKNLETQKIIALPPWAIRAEVDYDWRNPGTNYVQLWDEKQSSQIQTLEGRIAIPLGKYENLLLRDISSAHSVSNQEDWFTFIYESDGESQEGIWKEGEILRDDISWIRSSKIEGIFYLSEDYLKGECLYHIQSGWRSNLYMTLNHTFGDLFIGESKKSLDLLTQENKVKILRYMDKQLLDMSPKEFDVWLAMDFSTTNHPNQFLFVKKGEAVGEIYCYEKEKWNFIQSTGIVFEENSYHKARADWDEVEESYMVIMEKTDGPPSFGYYFLDTNYFLEMQECYPVLPKSKANLIGQIENHHQRFTLFNRKGEILFQVSGLSKNFERGNKVFYVKNDEPMRFYYIDLVTGTHKMIQGELQWVYNPDIKLEVELFRCKNGRDVLFLVDQECFIELPKEIEVENILYASAKEQMIILQTKLDQEGMIQLLKLNWETEE